MKRQLLLVLFFVYVFSTLSARETVGTIGPETDRDSLESVTVTGTRVSMSLNKSARIVTIMDSVSIASAPADNVNDILKYALGVDVRQRGAMGMQTDISVRGGTFDQIAVLLNGINISDPQTGHNAADFPVNMTDIERIEILEGPAARVYGTSSLVGAVNVVTRQPSATGATVRLEGGDMGTASASVAGALVSGKMSHTLSAGYQRSDGFSRNSEGGLNNDFSTAKLFYRGSADFGRRGLDIQAGLSVKDFGSSTFYSSKFDDQFEHTFKTFAAVKSAGKGFLHLTPSAYWNRSEDRFELFRNAPDKYPFNYHVTNVAGFGLSSEIDTRLGRTSFGGEIRHEGIRSTNLGEPLDNPHGHYVVGLDRTFYNLFLEHNIILRRLTLSGGFGAVKNTGNDEPMKLYPGFDASYRIGSSWKLYASFNTSFRMPTFTDLYYSVGGHQADKNLRAEKMQAYEGGVKYYRSGITAILSVYYHRGHDLIDWIRNSSLGEDAPWTSVNHTVLNTLGEEATLRLDFPVLTDNADFFVRTLNLGYSHISQSKKLEPGLQSAYSMEFLRHKAVAQADFRIIRSLGLNVTYRFVDRVSSSDKIRPYSLVDAKLKWNAPKYSVYLKANNLLDADYFDFGDIPQPGLWLLAGLSVNL